MGLVFIKEDGRYKFVTSPGYNSLMDKLTGRFVRWGKTTDDDPSFAPGPEILDLEISYGGKCAGNCDFCYKGNGGEQPVFNMTLEQFKTLLSKMPPTLTQIAFGIMNISSNPDFFHMMAYARSQGVIPNYTCHGYDMTQEAAKLSAELCGAVSVSVYSKEHSYNTIQMLTQAGCKQVNIHFMLAEETFERGLTVMEDLRSDPRLAGVRSIVFLAYKPKGRNAGQFTTIKDVEKYKHLIQLCEGRIGNEELGIPNVKPLNLASDSCSAPMLLKAFEGTPRYEQITLVVEPCEASCFSSYINAEGMYFPCSFTEGESGWEEGLDALNCADFIKDVWEHPRTLEFRNNLLKTTTHCVGCPSQPLCRTCPVFDLRGC